ncbi:MAG: hypothetical protein HY813_01270 [Candidatus Portnoybacteria bacterium]|nr:hypothetical protein [Candidatus Portnoybacteria bacterium]
MAKINRPQIKKVARFLRGLPGDDCGLNFYNLEGDEKEIIASRMYPPLNHQQAINFFFFVCLHQYGFWYGDESGYKEPLSGCLDGKKLKGSDLLWAVCKKALDHDFLIFEPARLAEMSFNDLREKIFTDANGPIDFPDNQERHQLTNCYGQWFVENKSEPTKIVELAHSLNRSLGFFLWLTREVPGYNRDRFKKKNLLLAMVLSNRPEKFLEVKDPQSWSPIVDYHLMRLALRLGLVDLKKSEQRANEKRLWIDALAEYRIRRATYRAIKRLISKSGKSMPFIDKLFWTGRQYCPEMEDQECSQCIFSEVCKKRTELFQPIFRTTAY